MNRLCFDVKDLKNRFIAVKVYGAKMNFRPLRVFPSNWLKVKTLGLVGESGSGKTTIGLLLMRLHEATGGQVLIGGKDILAMTEKEFHGINVRFKLFSRTLLCFTQSTLYHRADFIRTDADSWV